MSKRVPKIRFKGFTDEWEQRKFFNNIKNIIDFRGRTPKKMGMDWSTSGYLALSALNVKNGYIDPSADAHYGNQKLYDKWMAGKELRKGQVLFTTEAPMGNVAQVPDNNRYILSQRTIAFDVMSDKITDNFLAVMLRSPRSVNELSSLASGGTAKGVSQRSLSQFKTTLPKDLEEQQKIGQFFRQLDKTIALHQRKLDLLKELKKGFLQKMFPKAGEAVPEIRFSGFADDWEQRKFEGLLDKNEGIRRGPFGSALKKEFFVPESDYVVYEQQNAIYDNYETRYNITKEKFDELNKFELKPNDFIMSGAGTIGRISSVPNGIKRGVFNQALIRFKIDNSITDSEYFIQFVRADFMQQKLTRANPGSAITNLVPMSEVKQWIILVPKIKEQQKMGELFKQIDNKIALYQRKLDLLKELKRGFLQQMFI
ncbi:restriction endonuclease subunit S [Levilactobacillus brevis]|uniref:restriction endonuclease subunit S n=1 Tax=Levilactobacillus brevis TaxID=1580 RepID=UPI001119AA78|nr:restriction endonuclease subunit S [Levilactobacillus brevis]QCZ42432.1 Putative restriction-modification enzyme type I S subunit [Levilactobacillus brevis]